LEAAASSIDVKKRTITCEGVQCDEECTLTGFEVPYDRLVVAVGAKINTYGIPGVEENCLFLKQINDARQIRRKIVNLFERANFPNTPENVIRKLLTFAVIGAGPTGVEFAAELRDFIEEDGPKYYPQLLKYVQVKVIEATPVILRPFDEKLREAAVDALTRKVSKKDPAIASLFPEELTELVINRKVEAVTEDYIKMDGGTEIPYGLAVWAGGIGPLDITVDIIEAIGGRQDMAQKVARGKIAVDPWMRAIDGDGRIFALGDCVCTQGQCLPSTAQVAAQEGEFLAHVLSTGNMTTTYSEGIMLPPTRDPTKAKLLDKVTAVATKNNEYVAPFQFLDMGIMAYTGGLSALAQVQVTPDENSRVKANGKLGFGIWQGVYLMKQASPRNRVLVLLDWVKTRLFGRDITTMD
jgi:NADH dehydrogenase FAD-containing subunit